MDINGKVVWVTGGTSGIGRATAELFYEKGAKVMVTGTRPEKGEPVAAQFGDRGLFVKANMASTQELADALAKITEKWGKIDILVNSAANAKTYPMITPDGPGPLEPFVNQIKINLIGAYDVMRLCGYEMTKNEPNEFGERGVIIQISSLAALTGSIMTPGYTAAKAGQERITRVMAMALAKYGIRCNSVLPGVIHTPLMEDPESNPFMDINAEIRANLFPKQAAGPEVIASTCLHIVENHYINRTGISIDAGASGRS